ncbi:MAG: hypothetical protein R3E95_05205 [Thiolinea sp.]
MLLSAVNLRLHQGFQHLGMADDATDKPSMGERIVQMGLAFAYTHNRPVWLVLDAFFSTALCFGWSVLSLETRQPLVQIVTRKKTMWLTGLLVQTYREAGRTATLWE